MTITATERQVWDRRELLSRDTWRRNLPRSVAAEFARYCGQTPGATADPESIRCDPKRLPRLAQFATSIRENLLLGDGIAWIQGLSEIRIDDQPLTENERRAFYVALGTAMGEAMTQYGVLYPVRDRGVDYKSTALPVSMTNAETAFHTDSSSVDAVPDFIGLLCETPSTSGGESLVSNALHIHRQLEAGNPEALRVLKRSFVRDVVTPGVERNRESLLRNAFPVFAPCDRPEGVLFRYMRYWIERGQESAGRPIDPDERAALDALDTALGSGDNVVSFRLEAGDIFWVNNRTIAHNRSAYCDSQHNVRQLQRMWIQTTPS